MKHISIAEHGSFLGLTGDRLVVHENSKAIAEYPLSRIKTVRIVQTGVSFSSNLLLQLSARGIQLFIVDFRGQIVCSLSGNHQHAVTEVRKRQFAFTDTSNAIALSSSILYGKLRNQRAVLLYFNKYLRKSEPDFSKLLDDCSESISKNAKSIVGLANSKSPDWRNEMMGFEGSSAANYWKTLRETKLLPESFQARTGRGSDEIVNQCLNFGYAILTTYIWNSIINAGLEPYSGILHVQRPGKPSLVLDIMEEYRPWCVDRNVIKMRSSLEKEKSITPTIKKELISGIHSTFAQKYFYKGKKLKLESILQRQVYRLSALFAGSKKYKPYIFRW